jgi:hypothetical protein
MDTDFLSREICMASDTLPARLTGCPGQPGIPQVRFGAVILLVTLLASACGVDRIVSVPPDAGNRTIVAAMGEEIDVTLRNVGPALYASPPQVSSSAVTFQSVEIVPPYTPAGPTQRFHLRAIRVGEAVVQFRRMLGDSVIAIVEDTIQVQ